MSAAASAPGSGRALSADASPATIRQALTPEDAAAFDRQWKRLMEQATRTFDLSEVQDALEAWRRVAVVTSARGHDAYRQLLATAGERARTGERAPDAIPWSQLKAELGLAE